MRSLRRPLAFLLALLLALPLQAVAVSLSVSMPSECPMRMHHDGTSNPDSQGGLDGAKGGCALMSFCQNLQTGALIVPAPVSPSHAKGARILAAVAVFPKRNLAPPLPPPRQF